MKAKTPTLEYALAGLLARKAQSGYDLRKTFATTAMRHYSDSPGSIYPALRRLEARGWIAPPVGIDPGFDAGIVAQSDSGGGRQPENARRRQVFALTPQGRNGLTAWLMLPVTRVDVVWHLAEIMLRFALMDGNVPRSAPLSFLEQFERELDGYVRELRANLETMRAELPVHTGVLAFEAGIHAMEAQLAWAGQARARLLKEAR
jgi:DNA-binding PadR family transcriptional regulator